ncbi:recombinase zinc beta ribbon domain-containing protein [Streptomyces sp. NPDC059909]|uniref:zinc ribbon domain-containing protein n=1 Tax=Streptomyces sp. NPDC059909 TaxID=3346998 RepID=UPI003655A6F3
MTFEQVQAVRTARAAAREKVQKHPHYLKGSIFCGRCSGRFGVMNARNRWGTVYPYFYCLGRAKKEDCTQSTVLIADVEVAIADYWSRIQLSESRIVAIREQVMAALVGRQHSNRAELDRQEKRRKTLQNQQLKLIEMRYADAISLEHLKSEQERITRELAQAQQIIDQCSTEIEAVMKVVEEALLLCANAHRLYLSAPPDVRRQLNQAVFARLWIMDDQVQGADLTEGFAHLLAPDLARLTEAKDGEDTKIETPSRPGKGRARSTGATRQSGTGAAQGRHTAAPRPTSRRYDEPQTQPGPGFKRDRFGFGVRGGT